MGRSAQLRDSYSIEQRLAGRRRTRWVRAVALWGAIVFGAAWIIAFGVGVILG